MADTLSFAERTERMRRLAADITAMGNLALTFSEQIAVEAAHMQEAATRFEKRTVERKEARR